MKVIEFLKKFNIKRNSDIEFALAEVLKIKRSEILFSDINSKQQKKVLKIQKQLSKKKPLDLILKHSNFYGRDFFVNKHVLKPRQDTEFVCEYAIKHISPKKKVLDLCCGSGVIGITLAKECGCSITFADISSKALKVCKKNIAKHNIKAKVVKTDLFENINEKYDVIISNPPYIETDIIKSLDVEVRRYDPLIALDGGKNGLDFYKNIIKIAPKYLNEGGLLIFEIGYNQAKKVSKLMEKDFSITIEKDYNNKDRIVKGELKWKDQKK